MFIKSFFFCCARIKTHLKKQSLKQYNKIAIQTEQYVNKGMINLALKLCFRVHLV